MEERAKELVYVGSIIKMAFDVTDDLTILMSAIGGVLDYWAVEHGYGAEDIEMALTALLSAAKSAHMEIGMPGKGGN